MKPYAAWKYAVILVVIAVGFLYALPNLYGEDPAVQISPSRNAEVDQRLMKRVEAVLRGEGLAFKEIEITPQPALLIRFADTEAQLEAKDVLAEKLGRRYVIALNLAPRTPEWLTAIGAQPMYLGLDLRGGVHFLMEVDVEAAVKQAVERFRNEFRNELRRARIRYVAIDAVEESIQVRLRDATAQQEALALLREAYSRDGLEFDIHEEEGAFYVVARLSEQQAKEIRDFAVKQNITTLRNRVNELGVAEPVIQRQGRNRIVVQLPGVQDTARAKEILGATATLEFRLVDEDADPRQAAATGRIPPGDRLFRDRDGEPVLLKREVMLTGDYIIDAASGIDSQSGGPAVFITLDSKGARLFTDATKDNVGRLMAVVYKEVKVETQVVDGRMVKKRRIVEEVINIARIRERLGKRFQITGLDSSEEARKLALLLRAGSLAAPIEIVEERTVGPSLGQENIDKGVTAVTIGFLLVLVFMALWYRVFGLVANLALTLNLVLIVAVLSMLQATLTLPGIAGIVLTVGMAVDANVLVFERIREELRAGARPALAIDAGYEKAFITILDANVTTLIAALVLFIFGTGPVKGFAVTLSIGIVTSMFTAIMVSRAVVALIYGRQRRLQKIAI